MAPPCGESRPPPPLLHFPSRPRGLGRGALRWVRGRRERTALARSAGHTSRASVTGSAQRPSRSTPTARPSTWHSRPLIRSFAIYFECAIKKASFREIIKIISVGQVLHPHFTGGRILGREGGGGSRPPCAMLLVGLGWDRARPGDEGRSVTTVFLD